MSLYTTKIGNFTVKADAIRWSEPVALAVYKFPFLDGAALDNMGADERRFSMTTFWMNGSYSEGFAFLEWLRTERGIITFVHPVEGVIAGRVERADPLMDNRRDFVQIGIEFVEQLIGDELSTVIYSVSSDVEESFKIATAEAEYSVGNSVGSAIGKDAAVVLNTPLRPGEVILANPLGKISAKTRDLLRGMDRALGVLDAVSASVELPASSLTESLQYAITLPGKVVQSVTSAVASIAELVRVTSSAPSRVQMGMKTRIAELEKEVTKVAGTSSEIMVSALRTAGAKQIALETAYRYETDSLNRASYTSVLESKGFTPAGEILPIKSMPTLLTVPELEVSLYEARRLLDEAFQKDRENLHSLKEIAYALERHVSQVKLERDQLVLIDTGGQTVPLHVILRDRGLSSRYLELVMALNPRIENPTFTAGEVLVHAKQ